MSYKKREVVGTKYFLLLFGNFKDNNFLLEQILGQFEPILCSKFIKFHYTDEYVISHFETEETPKDIKEFCKIVLEDIIDNYILLPHNKNVLISLPKDIENELMDLEHDNIVKPDKLSEKPDIKHISEVMDHVLTNLFGLKDESDDIYEQAIVPTLDELLDKLKTVGIDKLTNQEKELLYDYSRTI
jgi:hypothetical protein